ncbi:LacI family DNA-binding transcriptional regulator [Bifidobacterium simiarum]|uniref:LacI family DNA-binding transcriptional regulator n=1 Tax=Bifidobacterium simiarum TaxID=2045441 RepID=UPI001BDD6020|nr:LacI family DNA-binding transcriptional regulator [Bifidobacterium simiarum]MBT1166383.1 LacI family DNA-binding transcriptional regulator [Bifidobacterium simiarum]
MSGKATTASASSVPSIANVAAVAGVSSATVSRVLSGRRTKDDDIARRVREAAQRLHYEVNHAASALRSDTTNIIGLIAPDAGDPFVARIVNELSQLLSAESKQLLLGIDSTAESVERQVATMAARQVDGLIIAVTPSVDLAEVLERYARRIPIVQIGGTQRLFRTSMIGMDSIASMAETLRHLADSGARSAAFINEGPHTVGDLANGGGAFDAIALSAAFTAQAGNFGIFTRPEWNVAGSDASAMRIGFDHVMRLFDMRTGDAVKTNGTTVIAEEANEADGFHRRPEALICINDAMALGVIHALHTLGLRVPQDVRIVSHGDTPIAVNAMPQLTSQQPPTRQIAAEAMRLMTADRDCPSHVFLPSRLVVRESTRQIR